jgi:hypothetical protein
VPDEVPAQEPANKGTDSEILNSAAPSEAPAAEELHENASFSKAALLAEYTALKNEQTQRIVVRDTVLYVSITANTAIAAIYQQQQNQDPRILLAIPFVSTLLFWIYATNDSMITQIRRYIVSNIVQSKILRWPRGKCRQPVWMGVFASPQDICALNLEDHPSHRGMVHVLRRIDCRSGRDCS